jgi:hypothetical protein
MAIFFLKDILLEYGILLSESDKTLFTSTGKCKFIEKVKKDMSS